MKKIILFLLFLGLFFGKLGFIRAESVNVNAVVPSKVCLQYSAVTQNVNNLLSDLSQRAIITVKVYDCSNNPLKDIPLAISSNRGEVDWIRFSDSGGNLLDLVDGKPVGKSDENGFAYIRVASKVPGEAQLTVVADTLVEFEPVKIKFLPLPFPTNVTVSVEVPSFINQDKKITLFKPSGADKIDREKLVNLGVEIIVPFWLVVLVLSLLAMTPLLFVVIIALLGRIKKYEKYNKLFLEREEKLLQEEVAEIKMQREEIKKEEAILENIVNKEIKNKDN